MDCSPPGSSENGISQARILGWVAISFSRGSSQPRGQIPVSFIAGRFFTTEPRGKPSLNNIQSWWNVKIYTRGRSPCTQNHILYIRPKRLLISLVVQSVKRLLAMRDTWVRSLGREDPLEKEMAAHSSTLAWKIPWMEEPGGLQSVGLQRVGHNWATSLKRLLSFRHSSVGKESTCNPGDPGSIPESGRSAREGTGYPLQYSWAFLVAQTVKNPPAMQETWVRFLGREDPLEKG